jgi:hypothetical protein
MISLVIVRESTKATIEVPADMVNKRLRVDIHEEEGPIVEKTILPEPDPEILAEATAFYATIRKDLRGLDFDRNESYER